MAPNMKEDAINAITISEVKPSTRPFWSPVVDGLDKKKPATNPMMIPTTILVNITVSLALFYVAILLCNVSYWYERPIFILCSRHNRIFLMYVLS